MKKLLILISLISFNLHAQDGLSFSVVHDIKLGLGMDKVHNDGKATTDFIIAMNFEGKQFEYYYFNMQTYFEHASLKSGYFRRYGVNALWNFNTLILPKLKLGFGGGMGVIHRQNTGGLLSYSGIIEVSYPISKHLFIMQRNEFVRRPDLETPRTGYNLSIGINYKI